MAEFPARWKDGPYTIAVPYPPDITNDGFRLRGVTARRGRKRVHIDSDLGFHSVPRDMPLRQAVVDFVRSRDGH